jgi:hypothetical protein
MIPSGRLWRGWTCGGEGRVKRSMLSVNVTSVANFNNKNN